MPDVIPDLMPDTLADGLRVLLLLALPALAHWLIQRTAHPRQRATRSTEPFDDGIAREGSSAAARGE